MSAVASDHLPGGRARILDEAARLFLERGYGETSLRTIAAAAGIQPASVYHYFASKERLLAEILRIGIERTTESFLAADAQLGGERDPCRRLGVHVHAHLAALFEHGPYTAANVVVFPTAPPDVKAAVVPRRDAYERRWEGLLRGLAEDGHLDPAAEPAMSRLVILGALNSSLEWFDPGGDRSVDELAGVITRLIWQGIGT